MNDQLITPIGRPRPVVEYQIAIDLNSLLAPLRAHRVLGKTPMERPVDRLYRLDPEIAFITRVGCRTRMRVGLDRYNYHKEDHGSEQAARYAKPSCA